MRDKPHTKYSHWHWRGHRHWLHLSSLSLFCLSISLLAFPSHALPPLQLYVEITPEGGVLTLPPGRYAGPVVINKAITIDGKGQVFVENKNEGSVFQIKADNVTLRGLHISRSGRKHDGVDAGILIESDHNTVEDNILEDVLFGIHLKQANNNIIRGNQITSLDRDVSLRGDGLRLWYSNDNLIENNRLIRTRDVVFSNASDNRFIGNHIENSRVGMELVFSHGNEIANNTIRQNITGIVVIYSNELTIHDNHISHMRKLTGSGISLKESAEVAIRQNEIAHCNIGLLINAPLDPLNQMTINHNLLTYNVLGMYFYGEKGGHHLIDNRFANNFTDAMGSALPVVRENHWQNNEWDRYQGFDQNQDQIGDAPHEVYLYTEHLWEDTPMARFYRGSPVMTLLDIAAKLAPFSMVNLEYRDPEPRLSR